MMGPFCFLEELTTAEGAESSKCDITIEAFVATCLRTQTPILPHRGNRTKIEPLIRLTPKKPRDLLVGLGESLTGEEGFRRVVERDLGGRRQGTKTTCTMS